MRLSILFAGLIAFAMTYGAADYAAADTDNAFRVAEGDPSFNVSALVEGGGNRKSVKKTIRYSGDQPPGTIIISTDDRTLTLVLENGKAIQYGVGVGRPGFQWGGNMRISRKAEWPGWTPPPAMRRRQPYLPAFMPGGPDNPLGARALYLGSSIYRIHGTNEADTIGGQVSSGCIRMMNNDVIDLYERVNVGTRVIVLR
ncbi:MAG: L,D-transpeptidase [Fimbriimonadaceae bacterium]|nr:L,D-transpeptidase [Alphaproteobacteria bacterium]